jgi:hypothetical protein
MAVFPCRGSTVVLPKTCAVSSVSHTRRPALWTDGLCRGRFSGLERWVFASSPGSVPSQGLVGQATLPQHAEFLVGLRVNAIIQLPATPTP